MARPRKWSDDEILDSIREWVEKYGRIPSMREWEQSHEGTHPVKKTVVERCGSWNDAIVMAGFEPRESMGTPRDASIAEEMLSFRKSGMTNQEIADLYMVAAQTVRRYIGPNPKPPRKPVTAAERREARIAALRKALTKNN